MPHVLLLIKKENQTLLPLHEHPLKSQHVKILQQVHHVYVKFLPDLQEYTNLDARTYDAEKLLERFKSRMNII